MKPVNTLFMAILVACSSEPQPPIEEPPPSRPNIVLISMDTTRADALGCYADASHWALSVPEEARVAPKTPVLDALAAKGVRYRWALAHAPTTLSSHTTMLTGRDPHRHAVVRNGYPVSSELPLVQERLATEGGYDTVAVIGSSALEQKMKLDRGFRRYVDPGPQPPGGMMMLPASEVTRRALAEVDARPAESADDPLFLFVHYYDPHMPWQFAPEELRRTFLPADYQGFVDGSMKGVGLLTHARKTGKLRFGDAKAARAYYLAEVAWVDQQLGVLMEGLEQRGLLEDTLVIVTSDHGETLEESSSHPYTHGPEASLVALHVPLLMAGHGARFESLPQQRVVDRPVRLMDLASTIVSTAGLGAVHGDGRDLTPFWTGRDSTPLDHSFAEATKPMNSEATTAWNNLPMERSVTVSSSAGPVMLVARPLEQGRTSLHRVAPGAPGLEGVPQDQLQRTAQGMLQLLRQWDRSAPPYRPPEYDAETEAALKQLGYLDE
jgi:arylsulfatase A-like enzyme